MPRQLELSTSTHSLPPAIEIGGQLRVFERFLAHAGYDAYQYAHVRRLQHPRVGRQLAESGRIASFHQSFVSGASPKAWLLGSILSTVEDSPSVLRPLMRRLEPRVPLVVHPNEQHLDHRPSRRQINYPALQADPTIGPLLHQPTIEVLKAWRVYRARRPEATARLMLEAQAVRGFDGIALDTHHLTAERDGDRLTQGWCERFAAQLAIDGALDGPNEVQLSLRPDFAGDPHGVSHAMENLSATPQGQLMSVIRESLPDSQTRLRTVTEMPASAFSPLGISYEQGHARIVGMTRALLAG